MTKADLYKRRSKNKQRKSSTSEPGTSRQTETETDSEEIKEKSLMDTINDLKNRMNKNSIENDVELIKANTQDTPVNETDEPNFDINDDVPSVKPVEKTYGKSRSKLDEYIYIESSQGLEDTEVAFPKTNRRKESQSPVPRKRRRMDTRSAKKEAIHTDESKSPGKRARARPKKLPDTESRTTKESIENDKTIVTRTTRKRRHEEITKPVLREKGQNGRQSRKTSDENKTERKVARAKRTLKQCNLDLDNQNVRMTRSRRRRLEISLSPSEVKNIIPSFSFESERRVNSNESGRSKTSNAKGKKNNKKGKKNTSKAKKPIRNTRSRANRR